MINQIKNKSNKQIVIKKNKINKKFKLSNQIE